MIGFMALSNFKCFAKIELEFAPLTLLCGLNGAGKSSIVQALLVLRQSCELWKDRLVPDGRLVDIGGGRDALFEGAESDSVEFELRRHDIAEPCVLAYDYDPTSDRLEVRKSDASLERFGGLGVPESRQDLPPFGGSVSYVNAEQVGPQRRMRIRKPLPGAARAESMR